MKKRRVPNKSDLEAIRNQIVEFACDKHDFVPRADEFIPSGDWHAMFIVKFRDHPEEEQLYCEAPLGEHYVRFALDLEITDDIWQSEYASICRRAAAFDAAVCPLPEAGESRPRYCRLQARAWTPGFSQRIFGLTLSNLIDCKAAIMAMLAGS